MKAFKIILVILFILATWAVSMLKPTIHKAVKIEDTMFAVADKDVVSMSKDEVIAWNIWRSNLGNKILKEKNVPQGEALNTLNLIEFNVDNKGNIFNIKIAATPTEYTQIAQKYYMDYLNSLNGNVALRFPKDSKRKVVKVKIPIVTSTMIKYSKPEDFSDNETIR